MLNKGLMVLIMVLTFVGCGSSGSSGDTQEELSVKVTVDKSEIAEGQSVTFDSNVTGAVGDVVYTWLENNDTLGTQKSLTKSDFSVGPHVIVLNVENSGKTVSDRKTITVSKFLLNLTSSESKYKKDYGIDENITFDANVTGSLESTPVYTWTRDGVEVQDANSSQLSIDDFNTSLHNVFVNVSVNGIEQNASVDFNVSDFTDLNFTTVSGGDVIIQTVSMGQNLMWVSDMDKTKKACLAIHHDKPEEITESQTFCSSLNFAGFNSDWRKPTVSEVTNFITTTISANILPAYYAPCKLLIGTDGGTDQAIITRYGQGKLGNAGDTFGTVSSVQTDSNTSKRKNVGLRCVRDN